MAEKTKKKIKIPIAELKQIKLCPFCKGTDFKKFGFREKKHEKVQVFYCNHCEKKFTPLVTSGKTYPVYIILQSLIWSNRFLKSQEITEKIKRDYGLSVTANTIDNWVKEYRRFTPFARMKDFLVGKVEKGEIDLREMIAENKLFHQQIYNFGYHRWKTDAILNEQFKNFKLKAIKEFLELIIAECPHKIFVESKLRASDGKGKFNLDEVRITRKENLACEMAKFVMQAVANNKRRHEELQNFMLSCDSTTLAVEVPVLLGKEDVDHYREMLNFDVPLELKGEEDAITGHIDIIQLRNGMIHIMDFKPSAKKYKPIEQLTVYALALARLTGLRLYNFKCAWFDEDDYYEFYPLHVVYKKRKKKK
ncbi:PD-(D/E)XK nuclease family protein [Patescibacteria group bacterium]|nr:PD-(D/E)XK nuclease family protein [Patescibacteria group bacterium]